MSYTAARFEYGVSLKSLFPNLSGIEIDALVPKFNGAYLSLQSSEEFSQGLCSDWKGFHNGVPDDSIFESMDIVFYLKQDIENKIYNGAKNVVLKIDLSPFSSMQEKIEGKKNTLVYEILLLLQIVGFQIEGLHICPDFLLILETY